MILLQSRGAYTWYRKAKLNPFLVYSSELELNDLWKLNSADYKRKKSSARGHAQLSNDPEKLPGIREMELQPSERQHFGIRCVRDLPYGRKENEQIQDFPSPSVLWWPLTWGCIAVWREKLLLVTLVLGGGEGCQTILLRVFGRGLKGWEDNEIRCP